MKFSVGNTAAVHTLEHKIIVIFKSDVCLPALWHCKTISQNAHSEVIACNKSSKCKLLVQNWFSGSHKWQKKCFTAHQVMDKCIGLDSQKLITNSTTLLLQALHTSIVGQIWYTIMRSKICPSTVSLNTQIKNHIFRW